MLYLMRLSIRVGIITTQPDSGSVDALREIPRNDSGALTKIVTRAQRWLSEVNSDVVDPGAYTVLGVELVSGNRPPWKY